MIQKLVAAPNMPYKGTRDIFSTDTNNVPVINKVRIKKDFWDLDRLLDIFSIEEIASFYNERYQQTLAISVAKMVLFFEEAELSQEPVCLMGKTWTKVKKGIAKKNYFEEN